MNELDETTFTRFTARYARIERLVPEPPPLGVVTGAHARQHRSTMVVPVLLGVVLVLAAILGITVVGSQLQHRPVTVPPVSAGPEVVLDAYLTALTAGDCTAASELVDTGVFQPGRDDLCGVREVRSYEVTSGPTTVGGDGQYGIGSGVGFVTQLEVAPTDRLPGGTGPWFYQLHYEVGVGWRIVAAGSGSLQPRLPLPSAPPGVTATPGAIAAGASLLIDGIVHIACQADGGCAYFATIDGPTGSFKQRFGGTSEASAGVLVVDTAESLPPFPPGRYSLTVTGSTFHSGDGPVEDRLDETLTTCTSQFDVATDATTEHLLVEFLPGTCEISVVTPTSSALPSPPAPSARPAASSPTSQGSVAGPTPTANPTSPGSVPPCSATDLSIGTTNSSAAAGTVGGTLRFQDIGTAPCTLSGYPKVVGITADGERTPAQHSSSPSLLDYPPIRGTPVVTLKPGDSAVAAYAGGDTPVGSASSCPPSYHTLEVTAPGTTTAVVLLGYNPWLGQDLPSCVGIEVTPVISMRKVPSLESLRP